IGIEDVESNAPAFAFGAGGVAVVAGGVVATVVPVDFDDLTTALAPFAFGAFGVFKAAQPIFGIDRQVFGAGGIRRSVLGIWLAAFGGRRRRGRDIGDGRINRHGQPRRVRSTVEP